MDVMRSGYKAKMAMWQDGAYPPVPVVWFRVPDDRPFLPYPTPFVSRNYEGDFWDNSQNKDVGERNFEEDECSRTCRLPYYNGKPPARYTGKGCPGQEQAWTEGGIEGRDTPMLTDEFGVAPCCDLAADSTGGEREGYPARAKVRVDIATQATPLLASARASTTGAGTISIPHGTPTAVPWVDPGATENAAIWDRGGFYGSGPPAALIAPFAGEYEVGAQIEWSLTSADAQGQFEVAIKCNNVGIGTFYLARQTMQARTDTGYLSQQVAARVRLDQGDSVWVEVYQYTHATQHIAASYDCGFWASMRATLDAHIGPSGVCNTMITAGVDEPSEPFCITNPTDCCPTASITAEWDYSLDWTAVVEFSGNELPEWEYALSWSAAVASGVGGVGLWEYAFDWTASIAFSSDSTPTWEYAYDWTASVAGGVGVSGTWPYAADWSAVLATGTGYPVTWEYALDWSATVAFGPTNYLQDSFTGPDGEQLEFHTMNIGPGWTQVTGSMEIQSNKAQTSSISPIYWSDGSHSNGTLVAKASFTSGSFGSYLFVRGTNSSNYWRCEMTPTQLRLFKVVSGGDFGVASTSLTTSAGTTRTLTVTMSGSNITFDADGAASINNGGDSFNASGTLMGIGGAESGSVSIFDDFVFGP